MTTDPPPEPLRPRDLALLLLASGELLPRQRARDQQADVTGMDLKRRVLDRLAALDPEPGEVEATLLQIVDEIGPPLGPTRAIATGIYEEWQAVCAAPEWVAQLLADATHHSANESEGKKRGRRVSG
jgi:hypothetical protein